MVITLRRLLPLLLLALALLGGCDGSRAVRPSEEAAPHPAGPVPKPVAVALKQLGTPYRYGGDGPHGFDCSGLVYYSYREAGLALPRNTSEQYERTWPVGVDGIQPGDLLFFKLGGKLSHVGLYVGSHRFVHAPSTGKRVEISSIDDPYWRHRLVRAGRVY